MNLTAMALMSPTFQKLAIRGFVESRYPKIAAAKSGSRLVRSDGTAERFIYLYDHAINGKCVGKCLPKTMEMLRDAGLWERQSARFQDYAPDQAYEHWYPCE